jgi:hypothetical protein
MKQLTMYKFHAERVASFYEHFYSQFKNEKPELPDESVRGIVANMTIGYVYGIYRSGMMDTETGSALLHLASKVLPKAHIDWEAVIAREVQNETDQHPVQPND